MSADPQDPRATADDLAVPGALPVPGAEAPTRLDPALDPDRYDPARDARSGMTLPELLGDGAFEDERNTYEWAYGLLVVLGFLALVSWFFGSVVSG